MIEGMDSFKVAKLMAENKQQEQQPQPTKTKVYIKNAGVYKFEGKPKDI